MQKENERARGWRQRLGLAAERHAALHLEERGCAIVARRHRCRHGEIDLVVHDAETLAFVEVKARSSLRAGSPEEAVDARKQRRIVSVARCYLRRSGPVGAVRFDVVSVELAGGRAAVTWIRDAFRP